MFCPIIYAITYVLIITTITGCLGSRSREVRSVEKELGVVLPDSVAVLNHYVFQPNPDYKDYYVYVKMQSEEHAFISLMEKMTIPLFDSTAPQLRLYLPGAWKQMDSPKLEWWDPDPTSIPDNTGLLAGSNRVAVAKFENGFIYIVIHNFAR